MIVRIPSPTDKNYSEMLYNDYQELFDAANDWLEQNNSPQRITTISNYFEALQGKKSLLRNYNDGKFLRIPLDEGLFVIDANSREIDIPPEFDPKNGKAIGVQGDHLAEILFFKIARYFDEMDLDTCDCHIEWINARGDKMFSPAYAKQLVIDDDKGNDCSIIFGWIIDQNLMALAGEVKFAVRFVQHDEDNEEIITFNYLTSPATLKVLPCLPVEYGSLVESDYRQTLSSRPMYSGVISYTGIKPVIVDYSWKGQPFVNLVDGKFTLKVDAQDLDTQDQANNSLVYRWYKDNGILDKQDTNTLVATGYGEYYAMVGNEQDTGTTWVQSQICRIPAAGPVTIKLAEGNVIKGYSTGENKITSLTAVAEVADGNVGTLAYNWYNILGDEAESIGNAATLTLAEQAYGDYYATVQHDLNNSPATSASMKDNDIIVSIRPEPVRPERDNLSIEYNEAQNAYICKESSGMDDLQYQWKYVDDETGKEISLFGGLYVDINKVTVEDIITATGAEPTTNDSLEVRVRQIRFKGDAIERTSGNTVLSYSF